MLLLAVTAYGTVGHAECTLFLLQFSVLANQSIEVSYDENDEDKERETKNSRNLTISCVESIPV